MAKVRKVFEIAKDLGVTSKAIVEKCRAEEVPGIADHRSVVKIGLELTIRQWFSGGESQSTTAVETAAKVDLTKARKSKSRRKADGSDGEPQAGSASAVEAPAAITPPPAVAAWPYCPTPPG